ncbi:uncharacterized protein Dvir_GJ16240 [Drosophila virilis]|uniref:CCDC113/CCDC96 coiled-coil domain-containing protein n=2 Tax=Drosophila virilis TaxID=7244 RepID=B4MDF4_DROVI|nr:uncharacterized protein Dvir_GJ16240 [Drosophila virilis]
MIHKRNSMLALLNEIPDIEHLSEGSYCSLFGHKRSDYDGHFVPPTWDGGSESSSLKSPEPSLKHQETASAVEKVDEESSSEFVSFDSHSLLNLDSLSDSVDRFPVSANKVRAIDEEVDVARTLNSIIIRNSHINMVDFYNENLENQRRAALEACEYFLDEIIQRVVAYSDQEDVHLRRVLDKDKLIRELIPLMKQFSEEQLFKTTMEQRVTDHFARKKQFVFLKIPKTFDALNYQRLKSSLVELDRLLEVHNQTFDLAQMQSIKLTEELESARIYSDRKVQDFEQFVRTTLLNDRSNHLAGVVNEILSNMSSFRDELSELRLELLYNQHRLAEMQLKSEVLEDLGDGLKMQEYLSKQSDVLVLGTKIAERDAELNRLLGKINFDVHALAHVKCKEHMYRKVYLEMKQKLEECKRSRRHYRELIYQSKLKHNRFLRELHKIRTSGSLMHYPSLLDDYDKTVEFLQLKRAAVEKLRCEHRRLTQRISTRETKLSKQRSTIRLSGATNLLGEPLIVITGFNVSPTAS